MLNEIVLYFLRSGEVYPEDLGAGQLVCIGFGILAAFWDKLLDEFFPNSIALHMSVNTDWEGFRHPQFGDNA